MRWFLRYTIAMLALAAMIVAVPSPGHAQKQNNIWYFGEKAGIDFSGGVAKVLLNGRTSVGGPENALEGTAAVCDTATGALLFYTDGVTVWNRNHVPMANGTGLNGGESSTQSALIAPMPGNPTRYYIFTTGQVSNATPEPYNVNGLQYSIVDMRLDRGRGAVVTKNVPVLRPGTEKVVGVSICDGSLIWILTVKWLTDEFHAYKLTSAGLATTPVISSTGFVSDTNMTPVGWMQVSPNGRKIAMVTWSQILSANQVDLYDFNTATGKISNRYKLLGGQGVYGACFSPDNSKLYISHYNEPILSQYDLSIDKEQTIVASRTRLNQAGERGKFGAMQIGLDGRIYVTTDSPTHLGIILQPNAAGIACGYLHNGFPLFGGRPSLGLPNLIYPSNPESIGPMLELHPDTSICLGDSIQLHVPEGRNHYWMPADGLSCVNCPDPVAAPTTTTTYTVTVEETGCRRIGSVTITIDSSRLRISEDTTICLGGSVQLLASGEPSRGYRWTPSDELSCDDCYNPIATPTKTTLFIASTVNARGCIFADSVLVTVDPPLVAEAGDDITICAGGSAQLNAVGGDEFLWSPSDGLSCTFCSNPIAKPKTTTTYTITTTRGECVAVDSLTVHVTPRPTVDAGLWARICDGDSVRLRASAPAAASFSWTPPTGLSCTDCLQPIASPALTTTYTLTIVDAAGCRASDTVTVFIGGTIRASINTPNTTICDGDSVLLFASGGSRFLWFPPDGLSCTDCPDPLASPPTSTTYSVVVSAGPNCQLRDTASVTITVRPIPVANAGHDTTICLGSTIRLDAAVADTAVAYRWDPPATLSCSDCPSPVAAPITTTAYVLTAFNDLGCADTDTIIVTVEPFPLVDAGPDLDICAGSYAQLAATGADYYSWSPTTGLSCPTCATTTARPPTTTSYVVVGLNAGGCAALDTVVVTVLSQPAVDAGRDTSICPGGVALLAATGGSSIRWTPTDGLSCADCPITEARPSATTDYIATVTDADGCQGRDTVRVSIDTTLIAVARIGRDHRAAPGAVITVPIVLDSRGGGFAVDELDLSLTYDPHLIRLLGVDLASSTVEGWARQNESNDVTAGTYTVSLRGETRDIAAGGTLAYIYLRCFIGAVDSSEIAVSLTAAGQDCGIVRTMPGLIRLDSICGLNLRLIEINAEGYALDGNRPNPFNPTTEIGFSIGLDGPTRLEILDMTGRTVALLLDEEIVPGRYVVTWDASDYPSGIYYYRLISGAWSKTGVMTLMK